MRDERRDELIIAVAALHPYSGSVVDSTDVPGGSYKQVWNPRVSVLGSESAHAEGCQIWLMCRAYLKAVCTQASCSSKLPDPSTLCPCVWLPIRR